MTKQQFIKLMGNIDDDIIENYLGAPVDENRPIKLRVNNSRSAFVKYAGIAAATVCVAVITVFAAAGLRLPTKPGNVISEESSDSSDNGIPDRSNSDQASSSDVSSENSSTETDSSDSSSVSEPQPVDIGNGMTLTGTPLDNSKLEEFTYPPFEVYFSEEDEEFFDSLEIPGLREQYKRAAAMITCLSTTDVDRAPAIVEKWDERAFISVTNDGEYAGRYEEWGYTYASFYNAFLSAFTKEATDEIFGKYNRFLNYNGALFCQDGASGGNAWIGSGPELHHEFELISKGDTVVVLRRSGWWDEKNRTIEYDPALRDKYETYSNDFEFVMTENGWRAATAVWLN